MTEEELIREAECWDNREVSPHDWMDVSPRQHLTEKGFIVISKGLGFNVEGVACLSGDDLLEEWGQLVRDLGQFLEEREAHDCP